MRFKQTRSEYLTAQLLSHRRFRYTPLMVKASRVINAPPAPCTAKHEGVFRRRSCSRLAKKEKKVPTARPVLRRTATSLVAKVTKGTLLSRKQPAGREPAFGVRGAIQHQRGRPFRDNLIARRRAKTARFVCSVHPTKARRVPPHRGTFTVARWPAGNLRQGLINGSDRDWCEFQKNETGQERGHRGRHAAHGNHPA